MAPRPKTTRRAKPPMTPPTMAPVLLLPLPRPSPPPVSDPVGPAEKTLDGLLEIEVRLVWVGGEVLEVGGEVPKVGGVTVGEDVLAVAVGEMCKWSVTAMAPHPM